MQVTTCDTCRERKADFILEKVNDYSEEFALAQIYGGKTKFDYCRECLISALTKSKATA